MGDLLDGGFIVGGCRRTHDVGLIDAAADPGERSECVISRSPVGLHLNASCDEIEHIARQIRRANYSATLWPAKLRRREK